MAPIVTTGAVFLTSVIDAMEKCEVVVVDIPGAFMQAKMDELVYMNAEYVVGSNSHMSSAIVPANFMYTSSFMLACMNAPGISTTSTSRFSIASITDVRKPAPVVTIGAMASSLRCKRAAGVRQNIHVP
jgi:hypothetical protein